MPPKTRIRPWSGLLWGVALATVVLLCSVGGGLWARTLYATPTPSHARVPEMPSFPEGAQKPSELQRVTLGDSARNHPDGDVVRDLLQRHFNAINRHDYQAWRATVVRAKRANQPYDQWIEEYDSTQDGTITVHRIVRGPGETLRLIMSFVSTQDKADAPKEMPLNCLRWRVVYRVAPEDGKLRLGRGLPNSSLHNRCEN